MIARSLLLAVALVSMRCAHRPLGPDCDDPSWHGEITGNRVALGATGTVEVTLLPERIPGKPPHVTRFADVMLRNPESMPRWLLVSTRFGRADFMDPVWSPTETLVRVYFVSTSPRLVVFEAVWGGFVAVKLPAHGVVFLRRLRVDFDSDGPTTLDVMVARELDVDGTRFESMVVGSALSESTADGRMPLDASGRTSDWQPEYCRSQSQQSAHTAVHSAPPPAEGRLHIASEYVIRAAAHTEAGAEAR